MAFYELRQYSILPGKMDDWVNFMETTIIPFQVQQGMVITASFRAEEDDSVYIWMRRFESEDDRKRLYQAVYESDTWRNDIGPQIPEMMDVTNIQVTRLAPTPRSTTQ
ncbi:MAG: NIPSNAP family containing protein [Gammaproteobacteria bacterium]|uniref:NIPSNAP family containing protein n=1 Tax=OM182 bacterium MED-G24 TaxID=1986255 RepID=A0A2A5WTC3_9GAMM|nr:NIPSNAP family containing protein [Gammaproteobacteria bacterium]PDH39800.1 MAG: NIPSNAP family containing protein [OM182 bacterium MED-G24]RPG23742.1 MAG: NIPSNAP family containing protein [Gammaproteobacteria bacterium TMED50]|tara:strand:- start:1694 stop:2017 length:324 start_codon:yes stop_codon:yes gene_type:complete